MSSADHSPFWSLSGELRNLIYRFALIETEPLPTNRESWFPEPPLLKTCRRIRQEAQGIYYLENRFVYDIIDFDAIVALAWGRKASDILSRTGKVPRVGTAIYRSRNWTNLKCWIRNFHARRVAPRVELKVLQGHVGPEERILCGMFDLAEVCKDMPWEKVEGILDVQHEILVSLNPRWKVV